MAQGAWRTSTWGMTTRGHLERAKKESRAKETGDHAVIADRAATVAEVKGTEETAAVGIAVVVATGAHADKAAGEDRLTAGVLASSPRFRKFFAAGTKSSCKLSRKELAPRGRLFPPTSASPAAIWC